MASLSVEPATEADMLRVAEILTLAFADEPVGPMLFGANSPQDWQRTATAHWRGALEHASQFPTAPQVIKCVHTDPATGAQTIIGTAQWTIYDRERHSKEEWERENYTNRFEYIPDEEVRKTAIGAMMPMFRARYDLMKGERYGLLMYMAVHPDWRRMGAATACVRWGMERCSELKVPAYLEATVDGRKAYEKMGWREVPAEGLDYPRMMWWPEGVERSA